MTKKSLLVAMLATSISGTVVAQQLLPVPTFEPPVPPARPVAPLVQSLLRSRANEIFSTNCAACHGNNLKGENAKSLFTTSYLSQHSDEQIQRVTSEGPLGVPNHGFKTLYLPEEIAQMPAYLRIKGAILNGNVGKAPDPAGRIIQSQKETFKVETLVKNLDQPWGMVFMPDGRILFTERAGRLRFLNKDGRLAEPVKGTPKAFVRQDGGMFDVALPPQFDTNGWIYLSYSDVLAGYTPEPGSDKAPLLAPPTMTYVVRGRINEKNEWVDQEFLFKAPEEVFTYPADHYGSRFLFDGKGHLFWTMGDRHDMQAAQNLASPLGKIHRINEDGSIPPDNPFVHTPGALGSIWTYGHRNPEGLAFDPVAGTLWESEHGPQGGDEINVIEPGKNYGWGVVTNGVEPGIIRQRAIGMTPPIAFYNPSIGPGGTNFYTGDRFPGWKNNLLVAGMVSQQVIRFDISGRKIVSQEIVFKGYGRVRQAVSGPDGLIYLLLQNHNGDPVGGSIVRLVPIR